MENVDEIQLSNSRGSNFPFFKKRVALAWRQLFHEKQRLLAAILGILFADVLMFMQFGFEGALFQLCRVIPNNLQADIVILNKQTQTISIQPQPFSRRNLYAAMNNPHIESGNAVYLAGTPWKNPETGVERSILVVGFEPYQPLLNVEGVAEQLPKLRQTDDVLFGRYSRPEFGNVADALDHGKPYFVEVNRRRMQVTGLVSIGASFANDGTIITSDLNFLRIFPKRKAEQIDVAALRIKNGADVQKVKAELESSLSSDLRVLTKQEFSDFEQNYWTGATPIGFIFKFGALFGFIVGVIITYQIIYTDVSSHLPEYATLKAMGYSNGFLTIVVFKQAFYLAVFGFIPSFFVAQVLYIVAGQGAHLELDLTPQRAVFIFTATLVMCFISGLIAVRKLKQADPADIF